MANRTPGLQQRSQYHRNWGNYTDGGQTTPANGDLPNQPSNALSNPEFSKLEAGDLAYVTTTDAGVYYCVSPGTVGGGDAVWAMLAAGGAVVQTIRDAHEIVVGQSSAPYSNVLGQDADVLDPGDGTGIETALSNATALVVGGYEGVDVRLRPHSITLDPSALGAVPLVVSTNVRLIGPGRRQGLIVGGDGTGATSQDMFTLGVRATLEDLQLQSPEPVVAPAAGTGMVNVGTSSRVQSCRFIMDRSPTTPRSGTVNAIQGVGGEGVIVDDCQFELDDLLPDGQQSTCVFLGPAAIFDSVTWDPVVRDCRAAGGNRFVFLRNIEGGVVQDCQHDSAVSPNPSIGWEISASLAVVGLNFARGLRVSGYRLTCTDDDQGGHVGIGIEVTTADPAGTEVGAIELSDIKMLWEGVAQPGNSRTGILIATSGPGGGDTAEIEEVNICNVSILGGPGLAPDNGVLVQASGDDDAIMTVSIVNLATTNSGLRGAFFDTPGASAVISQCSIANSKLRNAGTAAIELGTGCVDCIILGNNFDGSFTGITDAGTGTEAAHNIS